MADLWKEVITETNHLLKDKSAFYDYSEFYPYIGDSKPDYPFTTIPESVAESWRTIGNVSSGESISLRLITYNDSKNGGPSILRKATSEINKALNRQSFETSTLKSLQILRGSISFPVKVEEDPSVWIQFIDFEVELEYK